jgi:hypothetical protein
VSVGFARQALASYLFAYVVIVTIAVGALLQVMIADVTGARWFDGLRPTGMRIARTLPLLAVLALPILLGAHALYPWADVATLAPEARSIVARKAAWLNVPFFIARGIGYVVVWTIVEELVRRQGAADARPRRSVSAWGLVVVGLTFTFACFDWVMSLEPAWYSTIYGVYLFAGGILAALALIALLDYSPRAGRRRVADGEHQIASLGKLILTFAMFWAYIAFSQYLIVWIGDLPSEVGWYVSRTHTGWVVLAIVGGVGQFVVPFLALLGFEAKRRPRVLWIVGTCILVAHVVDVFWLVMPSVFPSGFHIGWTDVAAVLMVGGVILSAAKDPSVPRRSRSLGGA